MINIFIFYIVVLASEVGQFALVRMHHYFGIAVTALHLGLYFGR